jgi:hypothetical protein
MCASCDESKTAAGQYHDVEPDRAGFTISTKWTYMRSDARQEVLEANIQSLTLIDMGGAPSSGAGSRQYLIELASNQVTNGTIRTRQFGDWKIRGNESGISSLMMTDSQVTRVQTFLKSQRH